MCQWFLMPFKNITAEVSAQFVCSLCFLYGMLFYFIPSVEREKQKERERERAGSLPGLSPFGGNLFLSGQPMRGWVRLPRCNWATCACVWLYLMSLTQIECYTHLSPLSRCMRNWVFRLWLVTLTLSSFYQSLLSPFCVRYISPDLLPRTFSHYDISATHK